MRHVSESWHLLVNGTPAFAGVTGKGRTHNPTPIVLPPSTIIV